MQPKQLRLIAKRDDKQLRVIVVGDVDGSIDSQRLHQVWNRVAVTYDKHVSI